MVKEKSSTLRIRMILIFCIFNPLSFENGKYHKEEVEAIGTLKVFEVGSRMQVEVQRNLCGEMPGVFTFKRTDKRKMFDNIQNNAEV